MQLQLQVAGAAPRSSQPEPSDSEPRRSGLQSILATATALAGIFATANPKAALAQALNQALPVLSGTLPQVIAAGATIVAALSHPPRWIMKIFGKH